MYFSVFRCQMQKKKERGGIKSRRAGENSRVNQSAMEKEERNKHLKKRVVKLMSKENVTRATKEGATTRTP